MAGKKTPKRIHVAYTIGICDATTTTLDLIRRSMERAGIGEETVSVICNSVSEAVAATASRAIGRENFDAAFNQVMESHEKRVAQKEDQ